VKGRKTYQKTTQHITYYLVTSKGVRTTWHTKLQATDQGPLQILLSITNQD